MGPKSSRLRQFLTMLPFFAIGIFLPVYFYGFSGEGPPTAFVAQRYSPVPVGVVPPPPPPADNSSPGYSPPVGQSPAPPQSPGIVAFVKGVFESAVDTWVSPNLSPLTIKLTIFFSVMGATIVALRLFLSRVMTWAGSVLGFLIHRAAAPMFMGFLAVGSTWGIHETVFREWGGEAAAATITVTAAIAALFSLAGVRVR